MFLHCRNIDFICQPRRQMLGYASPCHPPPATYMTSSAPVIIMPIPSRDFDPSEVAVTWKLLREHGYEVQFATPDGQRGHGDPLMLTGEGLDFWGAIPVLKQVKLLGLILRANGEARAAYAALQRDPFFLRPLRYDALDANAIDGLILPGGHWSRGMRPYLEDAGLQGFVARCFDLGKPVGAICHGVVLAARSRSETSGKSALHGRKTVALTWAMEGKAWRLMKFAGRFWDAAYYRTYLEQDGEPAGYRGVQAEVAGRFAFLLQIRAVVAGVPEAAGEFHQPPRLALHRPGQRHCLAAVQRRLAAGFGPAARRQHHAVADRADRFAQVETARDEALQPGVFQIRPHAARPVPARQDQAVDGAGVQRVVA